MHMKKLLFVLLAFTFVIAKAQVKQGDVCGKWITENGKSVVEIFEKDGKYFGKIIWLKEALDETGNPKKDTKNPNKTMQSQEIKGLVILKNFVFDGKMWDEGSVYDPESGNTYSGNMKLKSNDVLELRGYMGISMLGRTATWVRKK